MAETYKKKGDELEITTTRTMTELQLLKERKQAKENKVNAERDVVRAQTRIDEIDAKLAVVHG